MNRWLTDGAIRYVDVDAMVFSTAGDSVRCIIVRPHHEWVHHREYRWHHQEVCMHTTHKRRLTNQHPLESIHVESYLFYCVDVCCVACTALAPPPPGPPSAPSFAPPPPGPPSASKPAASRGALLSSISGFGKVRCTVTTSSQPNHTAPSAIVTSICSIRSTYACGCTIQPSLDSIRSSVSNSPGQMGGCVM